MKEKVREILLKYNIEATEEIISLLVSYTNFLIKSRVNVISRKNLDFEYVFNQHIIDSLMALEIIKECNIKSIADFGTGGGLPGIPVKILLGEKAPLSLIDSNKKKILFTEYACRELKLQNVYFYNLHLDEFLKRKIQFDCILMRGINFCDVLPGMNKLLNENGLLFLWTTLKKEEIIKIKYFMLEIAISYENNKNVYLLKNVSHETKI